jgi:hypothetical protein
MLHDVIHRAELPIDDRPHGIHLTRDILHAAVRRPGHVDVWYYARQDNQQHMRRSFQIVGTGQSIPPLLGRHHGTAITPDNQFVWHILENHCEHPDVRTQVPGDYGQGGECSSCRSFMIYSGSEWFPCNL